MAVLQTLMVVHKPAALSAVALFNLWSLSCAAVIIMLYVVNPFQDVVTPPYAASGIVIAASLMGYPNLVAAEIGFVEGSHSRAHIRRLQRLMFQVSITVDPVASLNSCFECDLA